MEKDKEEGHQYRHGVDAVADGDGMPSSHTTGSRATVISQQELAEREYSHSSTVVMLRAMAKNSSTVVGLHHVALSPWRSPCGCPPAIGGRGSPQRRPQRSPALAGLRVGLSEEIGLHQGAIPGAVRTGAHLATVDARG